MIAVFFSARSSRSASTMLDAAVDGLKRRQAAAVHPYWTACPFSRSV
jgi:hypothetical protein